MSDETKTTPDISPLPPKVVRPTGEVQIVDRPRHYDLAFKQEQKLARAMGREARARDRLANILNESAKTVRLRKYAFMTDEELSALGLNKQQQALVRAYEQAKRNVPFAIESADGHIKAALKGTQDKGDITLNVENMTLNLPEKAAPVEDAVIIEFDATEK